MCASKGIAIALGPQQAPYCVYGDDEVKGKGRGVHLCEILFVIGGFRQKLLSPCRHLASRCPQFRLAVLPRRRLHF